MAWARAWARARARASSWSLRLRALTLLVTLLGLTIPSPLAAAPTPTPATTELRFVDVQTTPETPAVGDVVTIRFAVHDQEDQPTAGLQVKAVLRPPSDARDREPPPPIMTSFGRTLAQPGQYEAAIAVNQPGNWWLEIEARDASRLGRLNRFMAVDPTRLAKPVSVSSPVFLQGDAWGSYYRLDPATGILGRISGQSVVRAGERWFTASTVLTPVGLVSADYGGLWQAKVVLNDGATGRPSGILDLGEIRASVFVGSADQPAIATAVTIDSTGSYAYVYWARQLGQGWLASVAIADATTGEILKRRVLQGAISADSTWARLDLSSDGTRVTVAEQIVRRAEITGYRLTTLDYRTLEPLAEYRRPQASEDPLARCLLAYPGPSGVIAGEARLRYSLCAPNGMARQPSLLTWDPFKGAVVRQIDLTTLAGDDPYYVSGVASPDGRRFYAINTLTRQIMEIDLRTSTILRRVSFAPIVQPASPPSTWDRLLDWIVGRVAPPASAAVLLEPGVSIAPDGSSLYLVAPVSQQSRAYGNGVWVIDTTTLQVTDHLLAGERVAGLMVAPDGHLAVVRRGSGDGDGTVVVLTADGKTRLSVALPSPLTPSAASR